jgi:HPr kinase/phosphorylase
VTTHHQAARVAWAAAAQTTLHGVFLSACGLGVLLTGHSGVGKSELALDLITRGHALVADDAVLFTRISPEVVVGTADPLLSGFMEARGLGLVDIGRSFGAQAIRAQERLDLIIRLDDAPLTRLTGEERLHGRRTEMQVLGTVVPQIELTRGLGHNLAPLVETALRDHWLRASGYAADERFIARQLAVIAQ